MIAPHIASVEAKAGLGLRDQVEGYPRIQRGKGKA